MLARWLKLHHSLGLLTCLGVLLWGLSGITHPIMSRLQPRPAVFFPPPQAIQLNQAVPLSTALAHANLTQQPLSRVGVAQIAGQGYYRITVNPNEPARYFSMVDGRELAAGDQRYAQALARHYTGRHSEAIISTELVTAFGGDYHPVNRLLPVWRVQFAGDAGLRAFIDTDQARLATLVDDTRHLLTSWFRFGHNWSFLEGHPTLQVLVMTALLLTGLFSASSGVYFYFRMRKTAAQRLANKPLARWHRRFGILVAFSTFTFMVSALFHLWMTYQRDRNPLPNIQSTVSLGALDNTHWQKLLVALNGQSLARLSLVKLSEDKTVWLAQLASPHGASGPRAQVAAMAKPPEQDEHAEHRKPDPNTADLKKKAGGFVPKVMVVDAFSGEVQADGAQGVAKALAIKASGFTAEQIKEASWITKFAGEYGFINKRLPVVKVAFDAPDNPRYYIEPATATVAAAVNDLDALEGKSFAYLHKWHFTDDGKDLRDFLLALFAFMNVVIAIVGSVLYYRRLTK
ncbi:PepSY domain-containing protein [Parvibium lacunae]|uniref:PepSY domain-containing protein n=1 Tax=Parvibium lacunae TaxID=1888893 RepID=A0A368L731_9BURK|nr:PepSY domain-containing protein [Parvibium lacunae]RCS59436.1 PepSY domain-containing protein [Parvibium lacunae]